MPERKTGRPAIVVASIAFLLLSLVFVVLAARDQWGSVAGFRDAASAARWDFQPGWAALALVAGTFAMVSTAFVWVSLHRAMGGSARGWQGAAAWLVSNLARYVPGKVWQLVGLGGWLRARGDSVAAGVASSVALQAVTLATGTAVASALLLAQVVEGASAAQLVALGLAVLVFSHPAVVHALSRFLARAMREDEPVRPPARAMYHASALMTGLWVVYGVGLYGLVRAVLPELHLDLLQATGVFAGSYLAGYLVMLAPGGLVAREGALVALLAAAGWPVATAAVLAAIARAWTTVAELVGAALAALIAGSRAPS